MASDLAQERPNALDLLRRAPTDPLQPVELARSLSMSSSLAASCSLARTQSLAAESIPDPSHLEHVQSLLRDEAQLDSKDAADSKRYQRLWRRPLLAMMFKPHLSIMSDDNDFIPPDPTWTIGRLANGLTYYFRTNHLPPKQLHLRLAIKTGSTNEEPDQQGFAHLLEHLSFRGTRDFRDFAVVKKLESMGTSFGAHSNAYTSFDETVYQLEVSSTF